MKWVVAGVVALLGALLVAQEPTPPAKAPALTALEACHVQVSLLNETVTRLQQELSRLQLAVDRQQRTPPPKEGYVWNWSTNPQTGQPVGYVPESTRAAPTDTPIMPTVP